MDGSETLSRSAIFAPKVADICGRIALKSATRSFLSIVANGFDRATLYGRYHELDFFLCFRLPGNVRIAACLIPREQSGRRLAAEVAIDALIIDVVFSRDVFRIFILPIGHKFPIVPDIPFSVKQVVTSA